MHYTILTQVTATGSLHQKRLFIKASIKSLYRYSYQLKELHKWSLQLHLMLFFYVPFYLWKYIIEEKPYWIMVWLTYSIKASRKDWIPMIHESVIDSLKAKEHWRVTSITLCSIRPRRILWIYQQEFWIVLEYSQNFCESEHVVPVVDLESRE